MPLRNIKLVLEYDGSSFYGFQKQPHHPSVQASLEEALSKFFDCKMKITAASGRTDTGVHALHQVVNFKTKSNRAVEQIRSGLNAFLPRSVVVKSVEEVAAGFHARYSAKEKTYEYRVWNSPVRSPLIAGRAWHVTLPLNLAKMKRAAKLLTGKKDFRSFAVASSAEEKNTVRNLKSIRIKKEGNLLAFRFTANGFLHHMVRNLMGTLVDVGSGKMKAEEVAGILKARDRRMAGATAPASGLVLVDVSY